MKRERLNPENEKERRLFREAEKGGHCSGSNSLSLSYNRDWDESLRCSRMEEEGEDREERS